MVHFNRIATYGQTAQVRKPGLFTSNDQLILNAARLPRVEIDRAVVGEMTLGRVASTGHDVTLRERLSVSLVLPIVGTIRSEIGGRTVEARAGEALLLGRGRRTTRVIPEGESAFLGIPILIPPHLLAKVMPEIERQHGLRLRPERSRHMAQVIRTARLLYEEIEGGSGLLERPRAVRSWTELLSEIIADAVLEAAERLPRATANGSAAARYVRRAEDFMYANLGEIATIADVARELDISARSLELAFRQVRDASPAKVLASLRQHEARRLLLASDGPDTVTAVCMECGIGHPGRFAAAYRALFDESPAQTLARR